MGDPVTGTRREVLTGALALAPLALSPVVLPPMAFAPRAAARSRAGTGTDDGTATAGRTFVTEALGWEVGEDVGASGRLTRLIADLAPGDTVVFSALYAVSGSHDLTALAGLTLKAADGQTAGFAAHDGVEEVATRHGLPLDTRPVFTIAPGTRVEGLTFTQEPVNPQRLLGGGRKAGWFKAEGAGDLVFAGNAFDGVGWSHLVLRNCPDLLIENNTFRDGKWCVLLSGRCDDMVFRGNLGTGGYVARTLDGRRRQIFIDIIKTLKSRDGEPQRALIENNHFVDLVRDAIDTTGGLPGAVVRNNTFRNVAVAALDLKSSYRTPRDLAIGPVGNADITITDNLFENAGLVLTTTWPKDGPRDPALAVGDIRLSGNRFVRTAWARFKPAIFLKDCGGVSLDGDEIDGQPLFKIWDKLEQTRVDTITARRLVWDTGGAKTRMSGRNISLHFERAVVSGRGSTLIDFADAQNVTLSGTVELGSGQGRRAHAFGFAGNCRDICVDLAMRGTGTALSLTGTVSRLLVTGRYRDLARLIGFARDADARQISVEDAELVDTRTVLFFDGRTTAADVSVSNVSLKGESVLAGGAPGIAIGTDRPAWRKVACRPCCGDRR